MPLLFSGVWRGKITIRKRGKARENGRFSEVVLAYEKLTLPGGFVRPISLQSAPPVETFLFNTQLITPLPRKKHGRYCRQSRGRHCPGKTVQNLHLRGKYILE